MTFFLLISSALALSIPIITGAFDAIISLSIREN